MVRIYQELQRWLRQHRTIPISTGEYDITHSTVWSYIAVRKRYAAPGSNIFTGPSQDVRVVLVHSKLALKTYTTWNPAGQEPPVERDNHINVWGAWHCPPVDPVPSYLDLVLNLPSIKGDRGDSIALAIYCFFSVPGPEYFQLNFCDRFKWADTPMAADFTSIPLPAIPPPQSDPREVTLPEAPETPDDSSSDDEDFLNLWEAAWKDASVFLGLATPPVHLADDDDNLPAPDFAAADDAAAGPANLPGIALADDNPPIDPDPDYEAAGAGLFGGLWGPFDALFDDFLAD
jgi:hypothetical protein